MVDGLVSAKPGEEKPERSVNRWLGAAQGGWFFVTFLAISLFSAGIFSRYQVLVRTTDQRSLESLGLSAGSFAAYLVSLDVLILLAHIAIAAVIFFRRPNDWMALLVATALVTNGAVFPLSLLRAPQGLNPDLWNLLYLVVAYIGLVSGIVLLYLFPDGRFIPHWTRWFALAWAIVIFIDLFLPASSLSLYSWGPFPRFLTLLTFSGIGIYAQIHRYSRVSTPVQRQQTKWALLGLVAASLSPLAYFFSTVMTPGITTANVPNILYQRMGASFFSIALLIRMIASTITAFYFLLFPIAFAVAILRYRLWDIDILIRRTLIYSVLTSLLLTIYFASVLIMQAAFLTFTGQGRSEVVTVLSTLAIAALFVPMRRRVQEGIDKRFYHSKYDSAKTLALFSESLRQEVDLDQLSKRLLEVVDETMQPEHVSIWIKE